LEDGTEDNDFREEPSRKLDSFLTSGGDMPKSKPVRMEKELLKELVGNDFDPADLDKLYSDPQIAEYLPSSTISEGFDRKELISFLRLLRAKQEELEEDGGALSIEDIIVIKIRLMYYPPDKFPPRRPT
jgi:hypothetical protein